MKILVISYSLTGNNEALAKSVAEELSAEHIKITEPKPRTTGSSMIDMIFNKTPQVQPTPDKLDNYDVVLLAGPVWMGQVAAPLRAYFKHLKTSPCKFAFISISGGALNDNPKLADDLKKSGKEPVALIDQHIADLLPSDPKPTMKTTSAYRINNGDMKKLTETIVKTLREKISNQV